MSDFCKRNLLIREFTKHVIILCKDIEAAEKLKRLTQAIQAKQDLYKFRVLQINQPITEKQLLNKINNCYCQYDKELDRICIIQSIESEVVKLKKLTVEIFSTVSDFEVMLCELCIKKHL